MAVTHNWKLDKEMELRIYTADDSKFELKLITGDAEIFGYELVPDQPYKIGSRTHISVISWSGACLEGFGEYEHAYTSQENLALVYLNIHACLNLKRREAKINQGLGPKVLVCGSTDVGKSTLVNTLINYSIRSNFPIINVDLDIGQNDILPPGNIGAILVDQPFLPNTDKSAHCPLSYFYSHADLDSQPDLYKMLIKQLSDGIFNKLSHSPKIKSSGFIVNTCGYIVKNGLEALKTAIDSLEIDLVIVIDSELLFSQLKEFCSNKCQIVEIPKSGGVINTDRKIRKRLRNEKISSYFYGNDRGFHPHSTVFAFEEVKFYKIGKPSISEFCLPMGSDLKKMSLEVLKIDIDEEMIYNFCGMSCGENEDDILTANVYGFVVVTQVDMENKRITMMSPGPPPFPSKNFIVGGIKYMDIH